MWTINQLASETIRSIRAAHGLILAIIAALLVVAGVFESRTISSIDQSYQDWLTAGGMLFSIEGPSTGIEGERCDRLADHPFVLFAGGAGQANAPVEELAFTRSPDVDYPVVRMTPGAATIAGLDTSVDPGIVIGSAIANELGINDSDSLTNQDAFTQARVLPATTRQLGYDRSVLHIVPGSTSNFAACWAELEPSTYPNGAELLAAQFAEPTQIRPFLRLGDTDHASVKLAERASRHAWLPAGLIVALVWLAWWWTRRREFILYQSLHVGRTGVFLIAMFEAASITTAAASLAAIVTTQLADQELAGLSEGLWTIIVSALTGLAAATLIAAAFAQRDIAAGTKDF